MRLNCYGFIRFQENATQQLVIEVQISLSKEFSSLFSFFPIFLLTRTPTRTGRWDMQKPNQFVRNVAADG